MIENIWGYNTKRNYIIDRYFAL